MPEYKLQVRRRGGKYYFHIEIMTTSLTQEKSYPHITATNDKQAKIKRTFIFVTFYNLIKADLVKAMD